MAVAGGPVGGPGKSHICVRINQEENWGARLTSQPKVPAWETKASKSLAIKTCGSCGSGRSSKPHKTVCWRDPQGLRMYTNPPTQDSASEGSNLLVGSRGSD